MNKLRFFCFLLFFVSVVYSVDSKIVWNDELFADVHEVTRGTTLTGKTRMSGDEMKEFRLKVISILRHSVGEQSILAEIEDELFHQTGVLAGMSGSPVYFQGRLIGAVAFTMPNIKKPIVGITSFRSMFRVQEYLEDEQQPIISSEQSVISSYRNQQSFPPKSFPSEALFFPKQKGVKDFGKGKTSFDFPSSENFNQTRQLVRIKTPLAIGVGLDNQHLIGQFFSAISAKSPMLNGVDSLFVMPTSSVIDAKSAGLSEEEFSKKANSLEAGDLIGVNLARGDIDISAYGTVTHVENDLVFAFGHAMDLAGETALPLYKAYVDGVVPSREISYKVGSPIKEIGVIRQDRSTAIVGRLGQKVGRIPVSLHLLTKDNDRSFSFEIINNRIHTPWLVSMVVFSTLFQYEGMQNPGTFSYKVSIEGDRIQSGSTSESDKTPWKVDMENSLFGYYQSFEQNFMSFSFQLNRFFEAIFNNQYGDLNVRSVKLQVSKEPFDFLLLEGVRMEKEVYKKGEPIKLIATFRSFKKKQVEKKVIHYKPPVDLRAGVYRLNFSSEFDFFWQDFNNFPGKYLGYDFPSFLKFFSQKQRNDRLVISVVSRNPVVKTTSGPVYRRLPFLAGTKLARLPSTKKDIFGDYHLFTQDFPLPISVFGNQTVVVKIVE